jgi:hypothetical protein
MDKMASVILNKINISNKITGALTQKRFIGLAKNAAQARFIAVKEQVINDFNNSKITKEIEAGPYVNSNFLSKGNLVSFLGIEDGPQSMANIRNKLELGIKMNQSPGFTKRKDGVTYSFKVKAPTLQEIYDAVPSPWSNKSIIELVQIGVNNFVYFIFDKLGKFGKYSRSGTGLQSEYKNNSGNPGKVLGIPWVNEIMGKFRARFSKK